MTRILWAPQALEDLQSIRTYLARNSREYADLTVEEIMNAIDRLERHPRSGRVVPDAFILTVFHGARSFPVR